VIARFRRRHVERLEGVFLRVLEMCRDAGLIRLGLVVLDGTKVKADAALEADRSAATIGEQIGRMLAEAETVDAGEDRLFGTGGGDELPKDLARREDRLSRLGLQGGARLRACKAALACGPARRRSSAVPPKPQPASRRRSRRGRRRSGRAASAGAAANPRRPTRTPIRTVSPTPPIPTAPS